MNSPHRPPEAPTTRRKEVKGLVALGALLLLSALSGGVTASQTRDGWALLGGAWCGGIALTFVLRILVGHRVDADASKTSRAGVPNGGFRRLASYGTFGLLGSALLVAGPPTVLFLGVFSGFATVMLVFGLRAYITVIRPRLG